MLVGLGWLIPRRVDEWRQGRVAYLESVVEAGPGKISTAMALFGAWARGRGLKLAETAYVARSRDRRPLRFSTSGDPAIERAYRTHWISPELSERKRARLAERASRPPDLVVVSPIKDWTVPRVELVARGIEDELRDILAVSRAAAITGPRQSGKSTLARQLQTHTAGPTDSEY